MVSLLLVFPLMKLSCPNIHCKKDKSCTKDGFFYRPSDGRKIQRYKCNSCRKKFSKATFDSAYRQNKRRVNHKLKELLCSGVSMRRAAKLLRVHRTTVSRKLKFLGMEAKKNQQKFHKSLRKNKVFDVQFDDLLTIEHTKCKPLSVSAAVDKNTRKILSLSVSSMPAFGHLASLSRKKYGTREDHRHQGLEDLFSELKKIVDQHAIFSSDDHKFYPPHLKKYFPEATHNQYKGGRGCVAGQGELKKLYYDPLFYINHTLAMLRANINRLIRKSWCTTKDPERLKDHLFIYMDFHNTQLV